MADSLRIPPATTLSFQKTATQVCNLAKLDYDEWPLHAHELVNHLNERWREGIELGLSTDAAQERALRLFGDTSHVAQSIKRPWYRRLLTQQRYRPERYLIFLGAYVFYSWLAVLDVHFRPIYDTGQPPTVQAIEHIMLPFHRDFWLHGMGGFFVGLAGIASVTAFQWRPHFRSAWLNSLLEMRKLLAGTALLTAVGLCVMPSLFAYQTLANYDHYFRYIGFVGLHFLAIGMGWLGAACLLVELFSYPERIKKRQAHRRPFGIAS